VDTGSSQDTEEDSALTPAEARLLTDLRRINEAKSRLEQTLAEAHHALLRARSAPVGSSEEQANVD
jgi:hypothetical protein